MNEQIKKRIEKAKNLLKRKFHYICKKTKSMSEYIKQILEHASSQGYKSNAVKPLIGGVIICFVLCIIAMYLGYDTVGYIMLGFGGLCVVCFLIAYFLCLFRDPNLLRSEKFILEKTAIEKALRTDSLQDQGRVSPPHSNYVTYETTRLVEEVEE